MKTFPHRDRPIFHRFAESLGDIIGVYVVNSLHPEIWQRESFACFENAECISTEVARRVQRNPSLPHDVPGMEHRTGNPSMEAFFRSHFSAAAFLIP